LVACIDVGVMVAFIASDRALSLIKWFVRSVVKETTST